ncbi:[protein-PII] uridylyltransferase [Parachitinimonas caeni]|uniref:Bifunctional uridylyltransferase/uridylyl-removing enzyme n=1 Tax=Parachitinimonas caeni TaxID=3031301 RepID=A0ABT7DV70_9NEIS|nr:[protein-PII] uridylyltransferase [Parachitinimonas caeni]MDK2123884.1 [protein-PII] uridylyltransferase [Parachitinimonas caeni]
MPESLPILKQRLLNARTAIFADYNDPQQAGHLLVEWASYVDDFLAERWQALNLSPAVCLIAVGGYGRGQLFPCSDVDLLILLPDNATDATLHKVEQFVGMMWDLGLEIGHSVRTLADCLHEAERDITVQTAMLETRLVSGDSLIYRDFERAIQHALDPVAFFEAKLLEQQQRHERHQGAYKLEPNVKEAPGSLRDLHLLIWLARAMGIGHSWYSLERAQLLTPHEVRKIKRAERLLWSFRIALHLTAGRREDRILFDYQNSLALRFGYRNTEATRASEQLMSVYYRCARIVMQLQPILLSQLKRRLGGQLPLPAQPLNERFQARGGALEISDPHLYKHEPSAILETFLMLQQHPELTGISADTLRALWHARPQIDANFRRDPRNRELFLTIMRQPSGTTRVLRRMNQLGVLGRYIPAFGKIVGQMQHDLFHVYTVDEHILMVVRNLRRFATPAFNHEYPFCSRLIEDFERPEVLFLAGLFHDIAKGRGGDHSKLGRVDALDFCREHGMPIEDGELVAWLVEHHLTMSTVAQKQDVYDPATIEHFARLVGNQRRLTGLYLLTVADIRGTSPKVWNAWKSKLLEDLFHATSRALGEGVISLNSALEDRQQESTRLMRLYGMRDDAHLPFWQELDTVYFLRHEAREIAWHARLLYGRFKSPTPIVRARLSEGGEGLQVMVYSRDQAELFARICSFFERAHYSILDAKVYTTRHGYALDSFYVYIPDQHDEHYRDLIGFVEYELGRLITEAGPLSPPVSGRISRHLKHFPLSPQVLIRQDDKQKYHILSIVAGDRPGLLSRIARVLSEHQVAIHSAKIMTLGERAEDTFQISGAVLTDPKSMVKLEADLMQNLGL